jgi:hypothetical protein
MSLYLRGIELSEITEVVLMTGEEIQTAAELYMDDTIDDEDALEAINEALAKMGDMALVDDSKEFADAEADTEYTFEEPPLAGSTTVDKTWVTNVTSVRDSSGDEYYDYQLYMGDGVSIVFADDDTYTVRYRRMPAALADLTETPEIHTAFHRSLVTYLEAWAKLKEFEGDDNDGAYLRQRFDEEVARTYSMLRRRRTPKQVQVIRHV